MTARLAFARGREPVEGALRVTTIGGGVFRVPWLVTSGPAGAAAGRRRRDLGDELRALRLGAGCRLADRGPRRGRASSRRSPGSTSSCGAASASWASSSGFATCSRAATPSASPAATRPARSSIRAGIACSCGPFRPTEDAPGRALAGVPNPLASHLHRASDKERTVTTVEAPATHLRENPYELAQQQLQRVADTVPHRPEPDQRPQAVQEGRGRLGPDLEWTTARSRSTRATA